MSHAKWRHITDFPRYEVSNHGTVRDVETHRHLVKSLVQNGIPTVGLFRGNQVFRRSLPLLVAQEWLPNTIGEPFDTPIQLDGDRSNCSVKNLMWRPRWFAVQYHREKLMEEALPDIKVVLLKTGEVFESVREASAAYGYMERDIINSINLGTPVWPDHVIFEVL